MFASFHWSNLRHGHLVALVVGAGLVVALAIYGMWPYPVESLTRGFPQSWRFYDTQNRLLREVVNEQGARASWASLTQISPLVVKATVAVEDERFYAHGGVDGRALVRAIVQNSRAGHVVSGASTITMQLARLARGGRHRTLFGKLVEILDAWRLERALSKPQILEQYLNRVPYGAGTLGAEAASARYFGKPTSLLSLAEAALLAGLPQAPSDLNPLRRPAAAKARQRHVLFRLRTTGMISVDDEARALGEPLNLDQLETDAHALHFTDYILAANPDRGEIKTTLDGDLQRAADRLVKAHVHALALGGLTNAAGVVLDNEHCDILAMVGSADYWDPNGGTVNGATSPRQPGSALKPFLYSLAFERGFSPASVLTDVPTQYPAGDGRLLAPKNYDEHFGGPVLAADALGRSLNVPAIRLTNSVGLADLLDRLHALGFASLDKPAEHYGLGLALGNGEVTLVELAQAMATLARGGRTCKARGLSSSPVASSRQVVSPEAAYLVLQILSDERLRVRAFGVGNALMFGYPVAVKTGTSSNWRDSWAVGATDRFTVAVWSGDFSGRPMEQISGAIGAGPLFAKLVNLVVRRGANAPVPHLPSAPAGIAEVMICPLSGMAPSQHCPEQRTVSILRPNTARPPCDWHRQLPIDRRNGLLASPKCPARFVEKKVFEVLPPRFASWAAQYANAARRPPTRYSPFCLPEGLVANAVIVTSPRANDVFVLEPGYARATQSLKLSVEVDPALPEVTWMIDGKQFAQAAFPYDASWPLERGVHRIEVKAGNKTGEPVQIEVR